jgi:hypothetical protein
MYLKITNINTTMPVPQSIKWVIINMERKQAFRHIKKKIQKPTDILQNHKSRNYIMSPEAFVFVIKQTH